MRSPTSVALYTELMICEWMSSTDRNYAVNVNVHDVIYLDVIQKVSQRRRARISGDEEPMGLWDRFNEPKVHNGNTIRAMCQLADRCGF